MRLINVFCLGLIAIVLCGCPPKQISVVNRIKVQPPDLAPHFVHATLRDFIQDKGQGASVVVRDRQGGNTAVSGSADASRAIALVEEALMRQDFAVRDRVLFENTVQRMQEGSDYSAIFRQTQVNMLFEITNFTTERYDVNSYSNQYYPHQLFSEQIYVPSGRGKAVPQTRYLSYALYGFNIEVRVILLELNLIAGIFRYAYVPCLNGCIMDTFNSAEMRFRSETTNQPLSAPEISLAPASQRVQERDFHSFVNNVVIPSMFREMGLMSSAATPSSQPAPTMQTTAPPDATMPVATTPSAVAPVNQTAPAPTAPTPQTVAAAAASSETATLHVYRTDPRLYGGYRIFLGNELIHKPGGFGKEKVSTTVYNMGQQTIVAELGRRRVELPLLFAPGVEYYVRYGVKTGFWVNSPKLELMSQDLGRNDVNSIK